MLAWDDTPEEEEEFEEEEEEEEEEDDDVATATEETQPRGRDAYVAIEGADRRLADRIDKYEQARILRQRANEIEQKGERTVHPDVRQVYIANQLANELGTDRAVVEQRMRELLAQGYPLEAKPLREAIVPSLRGRVPPRPDRHRRPYPSYLQPLDLAEEEYRRGLLAIWRYDDETRTRELWWTSELPHEPLLPAGGFAIPLPESRIDDA